MWIFYSKPFTLVFFIAFVCFSCYCVVVFFVFFFLMAVVISLKSSNDPVTGRFRKLCILCLFSIQKFAWYYQRERTIRDSPFHFRWRRDGEMGLRQDFKRLIRPKVPRHLPKLKSRSENPKKRKPSSPVTLKVKGRTHKPTIQKNSQNFWTLLTAG